MYGFFFSFLGHVRVSVQSDIGFATHSYIGALRHSDICLAGHSSSRRFKKLRIWTINGEIMFTTFNYCFPSSFLKLALETHHRFELHSFWIQGARCEELWKTQQADMSIRISICAQRQLKASLLTSRTCTIIMGTSFLLLQPRLVKHLEMRYLLAKDF
ncbi:hypothetical protein MRB53_009900 [Persea americana]|uniref:Uncharacterized protein n=1 Tax=Persea americana TaxID=3435 RepID=A0ACC2LQD3_PERAE|nr:hypothetical protein MRB53_009900 [Persea americana]